MGERELSLEEFFRELGIDPQKIRENMREDIIDRDILKKWDNLNRRHKNAYAFGEEPFDKEAFAQTIRETFYTIKRFKKRLLGSDPKATISPIGTDITPNDVFDYSRLLSEISMYGANVYMDDSEDSAFTASRLITCALCNWAGFAYSFSEEEDDGVFSRNAIAWDVAIPADEEDDEFWNQTFTYNVEDGDMSEIIELARRAY